MNLTCKLFGHDRIVRDFYPHDPVTSIACTKCGEILEAYKNPGYFGNNKFDKMVCMNNKENNLTLTEGKVYEILYYRDSYFYVIDDKGEVKNYLSNKFVNMKEGRKLKLKKLDLCQTE